MRAFNWKVIFTRPVNPPKHTTDSSQRILKKFENMISHIRVTQETMEKIDPDDTTIPTNVIWDINKTALDRLTESRDTNHEPKIDSETTPAIVMKAHAQKVALALELDVHVEATNIEVLNNPYATFYVLDVAVHNMQLQIANVLHHLNRSRRT